MNKLEHKITIFLSAFELEHTNYKETVKNIMDSIHHERYRFFILGMFLGTAMMYLITHFS